MDLITGGEVNILTLNSNVDLLLPLCRESHSRSETALNSNVDLLLQDIRGEFLYTRDSKFQCGSIITNLGNVAQAAGLALNSNVDLLLPIHSQYSKNKHFSTPICRPAKITAFFITLTFNHAYNFYISRLYSACCRPPDIFTL